MYLSTGGLPPDFRGFSPRREVVVCSLTEKDLLGLDDDFPARYLDDEKLSE